MAGYQPEKSIMTFMQLLRNMLWTKNAIRNVQN